MLFARPALFLGAQVIFALGFFLAGFPNAWEEGANWWLLSVTLADLACLFLLVHAFKAEGKSYGDIFRIDRKTIKGDLMALMVMTVLVAPFATLPNIWLGRALFGNADATLEMIVRPLPLWVVYLAIISFSIAQGFTELPTYFGYIMPRLETQGLNRWLAIFIPSLMLGLQHFAAPLLFDVRFIAWRSLMFIPFALVTGMAIYWRPRVLPYFIVVHILMNMSFATMFLSMAY
jgi:hypothetical protein